MISSQPRYDRFDISAYGVCRRTALLHTTGIISHKTEMCKRVYKTFPNIFSKKLFLCGNDCADFRQNSHK